MSFIPNHPEIHEAIQRALNEDIGPGDITTEAIVPLDLKGEGKFIAREHLVVAGVELLPLIFRERGGMEEFQCSVFSGQEAGPDTVIATVIGRVRTMLECERVTLNFLQRLSGIATLAKRYVDAVEGTGCQILDTRKTTPGLRRLEKMAAAAGGVTNHRMGLFDAILIKNNHIAAAGSVRKALENAVKARVPVEIEVRNRSEIVEAIEYGAKRLLLDNLPPAEAAEEIRLIDGRAEVELSGGITLENVRAYADAGADFISCGAVTHSAKAVDINFRLQLP
jgi:nicotinate-nucleotide pyrophosphorylase (carboxylating)